MMRSQVMVLMDMPLMVRTHPMMPVCHAARMSPTHLPITPFCATAALPLHPAHRLLQIHSVHQAISPAD